MFWINKTVNVLIDLFKFIKTRVYVTEPNQESRIRCWSAGTFNDRVKASPKVCSTLFLIRFFYTMGAFGRI